MKQIPKPIKKALRRLADEAYEIELGRALAELHEQFGRWERGEASAFDLEAAIHRFHQGPARELWNRFSENAILEMVVAHAITEGTLDRAKIDRQVLEFLAGALLFWEQEKTETTDEHR